MSIESLLNLDVVVIDPESPAGQPERDEMGDPVAGLGRPVTFKGWYEQAQRGEDTAGTDQQAETWRLYLEPAAAGRVSGSATVTVAGLGFELIGPPWPAIWPDTGQLSHVEGTMRRVA
ncbi:MAG: hypothetical protein LC798_03110 [Chloroflexi bacterium]|nr:hypothetical protein [Chloroflexota bacterium]